MSALDPLEREDTSRPGMRANCANPAIMKSLDNFPEEETGEGQEQSRIIHTLENSCLSGLEGKTLHPYDETLSFLLIDAREHLRVSSTEQFYAKLNCAKEAKVKVVSIFGNTGDGKSHTLNRTFFQGREVFPTSNEQSSCTLGVWAAFDPSLRVICLDTEGLLGKTTRSKFLDIFGFSFGTLSGFSNFWRFDSAVIGLFFE